MNDEGVRQRHAAASETGSSNGAGPQGTSKIVNQGHPAGEVVHGGPIQIARLLAFVAYFLGSSIYLVITQLAGWPLYLYNKPYYYAYMSMTKKHFAIVLTTMTRWFSPTLIRISGDESVVGQIRQTPDGRVETSFPHRLVLIANHQLYFDWVYLWWISYANTPSMGGHFFIILKESLKYLPILGQGMMFFGFIFMSRKMQTDKPRLAHRLGKLKQRQEGAMSGSRGLDPMWLLVFPEGTNISDNGRINSAKWAAKTGIEDVEHTVLPRSTGSFFIFNELKDTVEYIYDCTIAYEGIPRGQFGQDFFTLRSAYFEGRPPKSVNLYWRRIALSTIPLHDEKEFSDWMLAQWRLKDALMERYMMTGRFPGSPVLEIASRGVDGKVTSRHDAEYIETGVQTVHWWEALSIFVPLATILLVWNILGKVWNVAVYGHMAGAR